MIKIEHNEATGDVASADHSSTALLNNTLRWCGRSAEQCVKLKF